MDDENTKARNEIMRRIKMYQMKERNMPNFVRKRREELLSKVSTIVLTLIAITCKWYKCVEQLKGNAHSDDKQWAQTSIVELRAQEVK